jgi:SAM-dependent methyltransferase
VSGGPLYDTIGAGYAVGRHEDPRIAAAIWEALGDARTVLNVGAGTGNYEPRDREVTAVEPSAVMRAQRPADAAPCLDAVAEALPFDDNTFDAATAILSDHHWRDNAAGLRELARVARRVVLLQFDNALPNRFWLVRDHLPEFAERCRMGPVLAARAALLSDDARMVPVPVPWDCADAFFHAHWRRPEAYLDPEVRAATSVWALVGAEAEQRAVCALARDLDSGAWHERNGELLDLDAFDLGCRVVVAETP